MRRTVPGRLGALVGLAAFAAVAGPMETGAAAAPMPWTAPGTVPAGDHNNFGNGRHNIFSFTIRSPSHVHGVQTTADQNNQTTISRNNAICKKHRHCRIHQRAVVR
ncbi:hypothetical protein [Actinoallomurus sp. NPDC052274]|uniref:hypothetical protein n=1 Tax=Actinoallomurus sp. NPDC052274 TaxID=3155420 RepID=UPI00341F704F